MKSLKKINILKKLVKESNSNKKWEKKGGKWKKNAKNVRLKEWMEH